MTVPICRHGKLEAHVYHLAAEPVSYQGSTDLSFSPTSFALISSEHDAILVDCPTTIAQGEKLSRWISDTIPDKTLKAIYITHGHGDHFFAANIIQAAHPQAKVLATAGTVQHMAEQYDAPFWEILFPNSQLSHDKVIPEVLPADGKFELEGHIMQAIEVGQGDSLDSTVFYAPDLDLVYGGDVVYGNCHQLFAATNTSELRAEWLAALDRVAALRPKVVVPSHQTAGDGYDARHIEDTKKYIKFYDEVSKKATGWRELEEMLKAEFPDRDGTFILRWTAQAPFNAAF